MEMPARRSNYTLLSRLPDDQFTAASFYEAEAKNNNNNKPKVDSRAFDWESGGGDYRAAAANPASNRIGSVFSSVGLQRQSSGSSFGGSSLSGEYYAPTLSTTAANEIDGFGYADGGGGGEFRGKVGMDGAVVGPTGGSSSGKSWAQQTEESYQLQLALALRLSSEATCADDPNFLDPVPDESSSTRSSSSADAVSHRFWVNGCLSYYDKVPDGFYLIHGINSYVWSMCTDMQETSRIPSIESLRSVDPGTGSSIEVTLIDRRSDPSLKELQNRVLSISCACITTTEIVDQLAKLVCSRMGGSANVGEAEFFSIWRESSDDLKDCLGSVVVPIGSLSIGLCRHRALLFKVLADTIDLPCRIAKGCKYCSQDDASSCLVRFGIERELLVDLIGNPGCLSDPDSLVNGPSSISISSPLRLPRIRTVEPATDFRSLAKQYFSDCQMLNLVFDEAVAGSAGNEDNKVFSMHPKQKFTDGNTPYLASSLDDDTSLHVDDRNPQLLKPFNPSQNIVHQRTRLNDQNPLNRIPPVGHRDISRLDTSDDSRFVEGLQMVPSRPNKELTLDVDDLDIPWSDLVLKERIGAGSFGTVHRADWHGSDVAVKILMEQEFHAERFREFLREVTIMKRLRHPNIVLFMGAVTKPPNLSIVTEYLSRGSLYRLLHKPGPVLDERRRLNMAHDVAKGMNYLHRRNPPIVHRDLKSPNLLVDKKYTVKVCDFGLSRLKANTFLSSKSAAGTPEWMAPEVLRDEPSNEKSDVYSFGVILWELATLQQPWGNLNPAQVVAAVGFKNKRLEIPRDLNPQVALIIEACWANEPWKRPSFASIMESLRPLIKAPTPQPGHADMPILT
ncbi:serine/threonine-protein kinase CTR1 [Argentina anserina]|uniref:serine/threonine-protein kinase CTR1 n=1 Tax=Argentina anserina TaxID=57926 RepID=UPI002176689B|nr:serine/threonine-protein kinase CTR1 [Potentilla anserina]